MDSTTHRLGIDVGARSVGFAAVTYDDTDHPTGIARAVSVIHDGGGDRKKDANAAARNRRRQRRTVARKKHLDRLLDDLGYPRPGKRRRRHADWRQRARAAGPFIPNPPERAHAVAAAARHIAHHPGQRSPWLTYTALANRAMDGFTDTHRAWVTRWSTPGEDSTTALRQHLRDSLPPAPTVGQVAWAALEFDPQTVIRSKGPSDKPVIPGLLDHSVSAHDSLTEWFLICDQQQVPDEQRDQIARLIFTRERPRIAADSVGTCALTGHPRAPHGAVEFEQYRVVAAVANLRVRDTNPPRALTDEEFEHTLDLLHGHRTSGPVEWVDVEDHLGLPIGSIIAPTALDETGRPVVPTAPTCHTAGVISAYLTAHAKKAPEALREEWERLSDWWNKDPDSPDRRDFAAALTDPTETLDGTVIDGQPVTAEVLDTLTDPTAGPNVPRRGRAAFSREACTALTEHIRAHRCDLTTAIKAVYDVDSWAPPLPTWDEKTGHPVVDEVTRIVRTQVTSLVTEMRTLPESVSVELARDATRTPEALNDALGDQARRYRNNRATEADLRRHLAETRNVPITDIDQTITREQRIRWRKLTDQDSRCLYCGDTITMTDSELDHIMPASKGGSNRDENKVAACRACNAAKDNHPFPHLLDTPHARQRGITLDAVTDRVKDLSRNVHPKPAARKARGIHTNRLVARLKATTYDQFDERSIASTGFAATYVRGVLTRWLTEEATRRGVATPEVHVYSGRVLAAARHLGRINHTLDSREATRFDAIVNKSRLDRRHHAVDAITLTALTPSIAQTLTIREGIRRIENERGITRGHPQSTWHTYEGDTWPQQRAFRDWKPRLRAIPDLIRDGLDTLPVIDGETTRPITKVGARHADTIHAYTRKPLGAAWTLHEINRVADFATGQALAALIGPDAPTIVGMTPETTRDITRVAGAPGLPEDPTRTLTVNGRTLDPTAPVHLNPDKGPWLPVRGGAAPIGTKGIPAARLLAWRDKKGRITFGMIRLYAPELDLLGWNASTDPLTGPLPPNSQAMRTLHPRTAEAIAFGAAVPLGVLRVPTEIHVNGHHATGIKPIDTYNTAAAEHQWRREATWQIRGLRDPDRVTIRPLYLAREGIATKDGGNLPDAMKAPIMDAARVALNKAMNSPTLTVINRDHTGRVVHEWSPAGEAVRRLAP